MRSGIYVLVLCLTTTIISLQRKVLYRVFFSRMYHFMKVNLFAGHINITEKINLVKREHDIFMT